MASSRTSWDLHTAYGIDKSCKLCYGIAKKGDKCGRYISPATQVESQLIVSKLERMDPILASRHPLTLDLARSKLCQRSDNYDHQSQAESLVIIWRSKVVDFVNKAGDRGQTDDNTMESKRDIYLQACPQRSDNNIEEHQLLDLRQGKSRQHPNSTRMAYHHTNETSRTTHYKLPEPRMQRAATLVNLQRRQSTSAVRGTVR